MIEKIHELLEIILGILGIIVFLFIFVYAPIYLLYNSTLGS